jgi:lipoprotein-anchoring transpeptidase ErfK/SrfK
MHKVKFWMAGACLAALGACSDPAADSSTTATRDPVKPVATQQVAPPEAPLVAQVAPAPASITPAGQAIDAVAFATAPEDKAAQAQRLIRAQVLLDRAHFSPGVIDGKAGGNLHQALLSYQSAKGMSASGDLDEATWNALTADAAPVMTDYVITEADVQTPFLPQVPKDFEAQSKLDHLGFTSITEMLAERFHMDEALLKSLNPQANFMAAGSSILVVAPRTTGLSSKVARIEIDKGERVLRAYDAQDHVIAAYPATVGSSERPAPAGDWAVNTVAPNPTYTYDPSRLTFGDKDKGKLTIPSGPNNPVGVAWIDLTKDTYGIHGGPDPNHIGKTDSHGCVRLTNWDVAELSKAVVKGAKVAFVGVERASTS